MNGQSAPACDVTKNPVAGNGIAAPGQLH
jgi:hypothetical protein